MVLLREAIHKSQVCICTSFSELLFGSFWIAWWWQWISYWSKLFFWENHSAIHKAFTSCSIAYIYICAFRSSTEIQEYDSMEFYYVSTDLTPSQKKQVKPALHDVVMNGPCEENWFLPNITSEFENYSFVGAKNYEERSSQSSTYWNHGILSRPLQCHPTPKK